MPNIELLSIDKLNLENFKSIFSKKIAFGIAVKNVLEDNPPKSDLEKHLYSFIDNKISKEELLNYLQEQGYKTSEKDLKSMVSIKESKGNYAELSDILEKCEVVIEDTVRKSDVIKNKKRLLLAKIAKGINE